MNDMMQAIRLHAFGGPEVLIYEDAPKPQPKAEELLGRHDLEPGGRDDVDDMSSALPLEDG
ncbi:hypothetical protein FHW02_003928 [Ochrobactrum sp. RH1CCR137]|nr:hypothetical protein [Ochrobactrum sp. RH1CCR137]MBA8857563.1 hypothetical protein [Ochrobactrum sp. RH1CCR134]